MPIQFDNFEQSKVDRLKNHLVSMAAKHTAKFYEIFVDTLKAVPKTDDPVHFDGYEDYMTPDTQQIKIVIYNTGKSPRNDQYVFSTKASNRDEAFMIGIGGLPEKKPYEKAHSKNDLFAMRADYERSSRYERENQRLKDEINDLSDELDEKINYINELKEELQEAKANNNKLGGVDLSAVLSGAFTHMLGQIPATKGLAGILTQGNGAAPTPQPDTEATFKRKSDNVNTSSLTDQEKEFIRVFNELTKHFNEEELTQVMGILDCLSRDKAQLQAIVQQLSK